MKNRLLKISSLLALCGLLFFQSPVKAQGDIAEFISSELGLAEDLFKAYLNPFGQSFGVNLNSGWINVGHAMKPGRFELKLMVPFTFAPQSARTFQLTDVFTPEYTNTNSDTYWRLNGLTESPTVFGSNESPGSITKVVRIPDSGGGTTDVEANIPLPPGLGFATNFLPPTAQLSVGLVKKTELMVRFVPAVTAGDASFRSWGVGVKHDIGQWIPVVKSLPFSISAMAAVSSLNLDYDIDYEVTRPSDASASTPQHSIVSDQVFNFNSFGWTTGLFISKKIPVLTVYGGLRLMSSNTVLSANGTYQFYVPERENANDVDYSLQTLRDPLEVRMPITQFGVTAGTRIKLGFLSLFGEYNLSRFSTVSAGIGLGWMD